MTLSADTVQLNIGKILDANASGLSFTLDDSSGTPAVTLDVQGLERHVLPDFPSLTGTIGDLSASNTGFTVSSASLSSSGDIEFGKITFDVSSPTLTLDDFGYTNGPNAGGDRHVHGRRDGQPVPGPIELQHDG